MFATAATVVAVETGTSGHGAYTVVMLDRCQHSAVYTEHCSDRPNNLV